MQTETVAIIPIQVKLLKRGRAYGYEITVGVQAPQSASGWATPTGQMLHSPLHALRTALKRCKNQGLRDSGLSIDIQI